MVSRVSLQIDKLGRCLGWKIIVIRRLENKTIHEGDIMRGNNRDRVEVVEAYGTL